jgi:crotonobetainyl-CoA:carnitine CoA-transferase CaiB-like acyl-CoA transferase
LDLGQEISGPYCAKLLGALGAQVIKVEPEQGDAARRLGPFPGDVPHPERSGLFLYLNTGKQGVTLDLGTAGGRELFLSLAAWADVVVENSGPQVLSTLDLSYEVLRQVNPRLILTSITPFGQSGPYRDFHASEIGLHAISGEMSVAGLPGRPLKKGGELAHYLGGLNGFLGTLGALFLREETDRGRQVDVSLSEGFSAIVGGAIKEHSYLGYPPQRKGGMPWPQGVYECKDGYMMNMVRGGSKWRPDIAALIGDPALAREPAPAADGQAREPDELVAPYVAWLEANTKEHIYHVAQKLRLSFSYVCTAPDILASPQLAHRGFLEQVEHPEAGTLTLMGLPFLLDGERWSLGRAPLLGEHNEVVYGRILGLSKQEVRRLGQMGESRPADERPRIIPGSLEPGTAGPGAFGEEPSPPLLAALDEGETAPPSERLPLQGVRVLDFTQVWAGPMCTVLLADMGAEVIKLESTVRADPERGPLKPPPERLRRYPGADPGEQPFNRSGRFNMYSRNKLGITLDLKDPDCLAMARDLVRVSDIVVENFAVGVLDRLGLGYEELKRLRPDIIRLALPGWGGTGPEAHYVAYGPNQEAMSGLSSITGYHGEPPLLTGTYYGDPTGGTASAVVAMAALWHRRETGDGMKIDLSQREAVASVLPEVLLEYQFNGRILAPQGNRHRHMAPHGCYPCKGEDSWIVIAVDSDQGFHRLCRAMGHPETADDPRFTALLERLQHNDELDELVASWTWGQDHYTLMHALQRAGVAAQAVLNTAELLDDPHYKARGFFQTITHPQAGTHPHVSSATRLSTSPLPIRLPAPCLGQHNGWVLGKLLGAPEGKLHLLEEEGKIGTSLVPVTPG